MYFLGCKNSVNKFSWLLRFEQIFLYKMAKKTTAEEMQFKGCGAKPVGENRVPGPNKHFHNPFTQPLQTKEL